MALPDNLKKLQELCVMKNMRYKGRTKAQLRDMLEHESDDDIKDDLEKKTVKELKNMCEKKGLCKVGNKNELRKRLESLEDGSEEGLRVIKWKKRGRKVATRPSETVFEEHSESDDEEPNEYHNQKKAELRQECLTRNLPASGSNKILIKRLLENDLLVKKMQNDHLDKLCESCEENPIKLHKSCISKWYCSDCEQYICNICKSAHEKLKITRTHEIRPYGTILHFNIGNDLSFNPVAEPQVEQGEKDTTQFLDFTVVDGTEVDETALKRKRDQVDNNSENSDINNSFELVYETPLGKIGYRGNKRVLLQFDINSFVPETPMEGPELSVVTESEESEFIEDTLMITPPPAWMTPAPRPRPLFSNVSPLGYSDAHVTFLQETPEQLDFSRDMFESSLTGSPAHVPDTPAEVPIPPPMPKSGIAHFVKTIPITPEFCVKIEIYILVHLK